MNEPAGPDSELEGPETPGTSDSSGSQSASSKLGANYSKLFGATTISNLGDGVASVAYPWLASAVTRNGLLISLIATAQRLPWLVFTLPAGVLTDRYSRRNLMVLANSLRAGFTLVLAAVIWARQDVLPSPAELGSVDAVIRNDYVLYGVILMATLLLGFAEVLYDNTAQTFLPSIVESHQLERANGRLWSAEQVANTLIGPVLGAGLLAISFSLAFLLDGVTFALSALLIANIVPRSVVRPKAAESPADPVAVADAVADPDADDPASESPADRISGESAAAATMRAEIMEGLRWLWGHDFLRRLAIVLGLLNMLGTLATATIVLFAQEILGISPAVFALMGTGGAVGGVAAGWSSGPIAARVKPGLIIAATLVGGAITNFVIGVASSWILVWAMFAVFMFLAVMWNVITVSLRQRVIPDHLLGRVNSVYRLFAWGMMPVGTLLAGVIIEAGTVLTDRATALRLPWLVAGVGQLVLYVYASRHLTTANIRAVEASVAAPANGQG